MNAMQIVLNLEYGGLEKLVISLSEGLNKQGLPTSILCLDEKGGLAKEAESKGIKVFHLSKGEGFDFSMPFKISEILKREKIDIIHTHNFGPLIYGSLASKISGIACVNTRHGQTSKKLSNFIWNINRRIVAVSKDAREEIFKYSGVRPEKVKVIYNGVASGEEISEERVIIKKKALGLGESTRVVGNVARLSAEKDHATLINAFNIVQQEIKDSVLLIVGDGPLMRSLKSKVKGLNLNGKVLFLGMRDDVRELVSTFDIFTLSSTSEGVSLTLLEAMREKKAIVATEVGGNKEVVIPEKTGLLVWPEDPRALSEAIIHLLKNKDLARKMGENGYEVFKEKFSLDRMVKEYVGLYKDVMRCA